MVKNVSLPIWFEKSCHLVPRDCVVHCGRNGLHVKGHLVLVLEQLMTACRPNKKVPEQRIRTDFVAFYYSFDDTYTSIYQIPLDIPYDNHSSLGCC
jgi:hypothetical protein